MVIKTMEKGYVNMDSFAVFTVEPKQDEFTVVALKPVSGQARATCVASVELGRYPSEKEATNALEKIMEHKNAIKEAEYFGVKKDFQYIPDFFTMPKSSKANNEARN